MPPSFFGADESTLNSQLVGKERDHPRWTSERWDGPFLEVYNNIPPSRASCYNEIINLDATRPA